MGAQSGNETFAGRFAERFIGGFTEPVAFPPPLPPVKHQVNRDVKGLDEVLHKSPFWGVRRNVD